MPTRACVTLQAIGGLQDFPFDFLRGEFDRVSGEGVDRDLALAVLGRVLRVDVFGRFDLQPHLGAARPADQADDLIELHFDDGQRCRRRPCCRRR